MGATWTARHRRSVAVIVALHVALLSFLTAAELADTVAAHVTFAAPATRFAIGKATAPANYSEAAAACQSMNGRLPLLLTQDDSSQLVSFLFSYAFLREAGSSDQVAFLGAVHDESCNAATDCPWEWEDGAQGPRTPFYQQQQVDGSGSVLGGRFANWTAWNPTRSMSRVAFTRSGAWVATTSIGTPPICVICEVFQTADKSTAESFSGTYMYVLVLLPSIVVAAAVAAVLITFWPEITRREEQRQRQKRWKAAEDSKRRKDVKTRLARQLQLQTLQMRKMGREKVEGVDSGAASRAAGGSVSSTRPSV